MGARNVWIVEERFESYISDPFSIGLITMHHYEDSDREDRWASQQEANRATDMKDRIAAAQKPLLDEMRRLVNLLDGDALLPDGSNADTTLAHALLGDFSEPNLKLDN